MNNNSKTLCIFSPAFPKDEADTTWLPWLQAFVKTLNKAFPSLHVIIFAFQYPHITKPYSWNNNSILPFNGMRKRKPSRIGMWISMVTRFYKIKKEHDV